MKFLPNNIFNYTLVRWSQSFLENIWFAHDECCVLLYHSQMGWNFHQPHPSFISRSISSLLANLAHSKAHSVIHSLTPDFYIPVTFCAIHYFWELFQVMSWWLQVHEKVTMTFIDFISFLFINIDSKSSFHLMKKANCAREKKYKRNHAMYFLKWQKQLFKKEQRDIQACVNASILLLHYVLYQEPFYIKNTT